MRISWGLARRAAVAGVVLVGLAGAVQASPAAAEGYSAAAHACQEGGHTSLVGVQDGQITTFGTAGECVTYAARGGRLVAAAVVQPCLNGGYADLAPTEDRTSAFSSEAACVSYAAGGGTLVPDVDVDLDEDVVICIHGYDEKAVSQEIAEELVASGVAEYGPCPN